MNGVGDLMTIGALATRCGLTVSALRFYDREGVLVPAFVDPTSGYRRYSADQVQDALLVASLRRIGMPVSELRDAVDLRHDHEELDSLLDAHLHRLARGLDGARAEVATIRDRRTMTDFSLVTSAADLRHALRSVRFAVSRDPHVPVLQGIRVRVVDEGADLVATDRYRLARQQLTVKQSRGTGFAVLPVDLVDTLLAERCDSPATLTVLDSEVTVVTEREHRGQCLLGAFPNVEMIVPNDAVPHPASRHAHGSWPVGKREGTRSLGDVDVREEFLLEALAAAGDNPTLALDGPLAPIAVFGRYGHLSLIMPLAPERNDP